MAMSLERQKKLYNRLKAEESLGPGDARFTDLDAHGVRGYRWAERLAKRIFLSEEPACVFFSGLPGSGKSTELRRSAQMLREEQGYFTVLIDAEQLFDLTNPIDIPDIWAAILFQTEAAILEAEGRDPVDAMADGYLARLWQWLINTDVELQRAEFHIPSGPSLVMEMKDRPGLRQRVRNTLAQHLPGFLQEARRELLALQTRAMALGHQGLAVILDSLEKNRGISDNWKDVIQSLDRIFSKGAPYLRLPIPSIFTVPPAVVPLLLDTNVEFMPMVKLQTKQGEAFEPGLEVLRSLLGKRLDDGDLENLLGEDWRDRRDRIIRFSGGYPRDIIRIFRQILMEDQFPLGDESFRRIFKEIEANYRLAIPSNLYPLLAKAQRDLFLVTSTEDEREASARLFGQNALLRYQNEDCWFRLHPAVTSIPAIQEMLAEIGQ